MKNKDRMREAAIWFGRMGQTALQSKFKTPEEKSAYFRELQQKSVRAKLKKLRKSE